MPGGGTLEIMGLLFLLEPICGNGYTVNSLLNEEVMHSLMEKPTLMNRVIDLRTLLLFFLLSTNHAVSNASSSAYGKNSLIFQKEGIMLHRPYFLSQEQWCNTDPKNAYHEVTVFYDAPHPQRLEVLGESYNDFVNDVVIPAIVNDCGGAVSSDNINIILSMYKMTSNNSEPLVEPSNLLWDIMFFISRPSGVTYTKYDPREARLHLSPEQIRALTPGYILENMAKNKQTAKQRAEAEAARKKRIAERLAAQADADRKANFDDCKHGCITLCNKSDRIYTIATAHLRSAYARGNTFGTDMVEIEGWWQLKPGQCYNPQAALYWQTYYSIAHKSSSGKWIYPQWDVDPAVLDGSKWKGMSGYRDATICIKKSGHFRRHLAGDITSAFKEVCPPGLQKAPVNLFTVGQVDYDVTYTIK